MDAVVCESDAMRAWAVCAMLVLSAAVPARGQDLIYRQAPAYIGGYSSDSEFYGISGNPTSQLVADDFRLTQNRSICGINWWAFFGGDQDAPNGPGSIYPPATETIRVRFYGDAAGLPGGVLAEQTFVDPSRTATGYRVAIAPLRPEYLYSVAFSPCFTAAANTTYWLEVAQIGDVDSNSRWETSLGGPIAFQTPIGTSWRSSSSQAYGLSFELHRTPEPTGLVAIGIFCVVALYRDRRKQR